MSISVGSRFVARCIRYHGHLYRSKRSRLFRLCRLPGRIYKSDGKCDQPGNRIGSRKETENYHPRSFHASDQSREVKLGRQSGGRFRLTWTCYRGGEHPCGVCDSCLLRAKAFAEANEIDPFSMLIRKQFKFEGGAYCP